MRGIVGEKVPVPLDELVGGLVRLVVCEKDVFAEFRERRVGGVFGAGFGELRGGCCGDLFDGVCEGCLVAVAGLFAAALNVVFLQEPQLFHEDHGVSLGEFEVEGLGELVHGHHVVFVGVAPALECEEVA